jgi:hypothetical protein
MATIELVAQIPLAGAVVKATLPPLINGMLDAIANGSVTAIQAAYALLDAPVSLLESILLIGNVATIPILPGRMQSDPGLHGCQLLGNRGSYSIRCHGKYSTIEPIRLPITNEKASNHAFHFNHLLF